MNNRIRRTITLALVGTAICALAQETLGHPLIGSDGDPINLTVYETYGEAELDNFGTGLESAGDFNGDGIVDLVVGAPYMDVGATDGGAAYLFLGGDYSNAPNYHFRLLAEGADDQLGYSVAGVGDLDKDGYDDFAAGARWSDRAGVGTNKGAVWVVFGGESDYGARQMVFTGSTDGQAGFGHAVAGGDFNGDGFSDLAVGAPFDAPSPLMYDAGKVQIFFGGADMDLNPDLTLTGEAQNNQFGWSVANAGDLDGDGIDDLAVGARWYGGVYPNPRAWGKAYVYLGGDAMDSNADVELEGANADDWLGFSVAGAGDVNGDSFDDLLIGAPYYPNGGGNGAAYLLFGSAAMDNDPDLIFSGGSGDEFGWDVDGGLDLNGDSFDDIIIGAHFDDFAGEEGGAAYIYYGGDPMNTQPDILVGSEESHDALGTSVALIGDWAAKGRPLAAVSAVWNDAGHPVTNPMTEGAYGAVFLFAIQLPGDVNGDGWVSSADLSIVIDNWGQSGLGREFGDLNDNGVVDGPDYSEVLSYWNPAPPEPAPEPATLAMLLLGGSALLRRRR